MTVTIKDIAKELGISYASVSRALNGKPGVSEETRNSVVILADNLGYQPNDLARGLVNNTSKTIGVIIPDIINPFFGEIVKGIIESANEEHYEVFLCISEWDSVKEREYINTLRKKRVDGIILKPSSDYEINTYQDVRSPIIFIEQSWQHDESDCIVEVDNFRGGYLAVSHLLDCGYKRIGFLSGKKDSFSSKIRKAGCKAALSDRNMLMEDNWTEFSDFTVEGGHEAARRLLARAKGIDAIFAMNDILALGAMQAIKELGLDMPAKIGLVGFDNIYYSSLPQIQLTTINQPKYKLGRLISEMLINIIKKRKIVQRKIVLSPELIPRLTTREILDK